MKILLLALALPLAARAPAIPPFDEAGFVRLINEQDILLREVWGCPPEGYPPTIECLRGGARLDANQWERVFKIGEAFYRRK